MVWLPMGSAKDHPASYAYEPDVEMFHHQPPQPRVIQVQTRSYGCNADKIPMQLWSGYPWIRQGSSKGHPASYAYEADVEMGRRPQTVAIWAVCARQRCFWPSWSFLKNPMDASDACGSNVYNGVLALCYRGNYSSYPDDEGKLYKVTKQSISNLNSLSN